MPTACQHEVDGAVIEFDGAFVVVLAEDGLAEALTLVVASTRRDHGGEVDPGAVLIGSRLDCDPGGLFGGVEVAASAIVAAM